MKTIKETWKPIKQNGKISNVPYMVSSLGNIAVIENKVKKIKKYKSNKKGIRLRIRFGNKDLSISLAKIVATAFITKKNNKQNSVICKDYNYSNCKVSNLQWATLDEHRTHVKNSPNNKKARLTKNYDNKKSGLILKTKDVIKLKELIWSDKRKLSFKQLAEKFGVSEMQIYRIKRGEIWFHIKAKNEPDSKKYLNYLKNKSKK
jgi:hypothetical protein